MHMLTSDVLAAVFTYFFFDDVGVMIMKWMKKTIELTIINMISITLLSCAE